MSRPATRAAVPPTAWHTISSAVTAALRRKRVNLISCARHPASRRIREQGRSTSAACKATPLFPGGDRQIAPAQIPSLPLPSRINDPSRESARWTFDKGRCVHTIAACGERVGVRGPLHKGGLAEGEGAFPRSSDSRRGPSPPPPFPPRPLPPNRGRG